MLRRITPMLVFSLLSCLALANEPGHAAQTTSTLTDKDAGSGQTGRSNLKALRRFAGNKLACPAPTPCPEPKDEKGPPLPFHTIEGYGGGGITPMAYLVNAGPKDQLFGKPSVALTGVQMGHGKNLQALTLSETFYGRIELSYGLDRFGIGNLRDEIKDGTGVDVDRDDVWLNNFNLRYMLFEEGSLFPLMPAVTAGAHLKINSGISDIDSKLDGALKTIGYDSNVGEDFTLAATKTLKYGWTFNRPLMLTAGLRNSSAAQLGFLGFGDNRSTTFEGNVVYLPTDWLLLGYEYRQKTNPYDQIPGLVGKEDDWQAFDVSWIMNKHMTLTGGYGLFGNVANTTENNAWFLQYKFEF